MLNESGNSDESEQQERLERDEFQYPEDQREQAYFLQPGDLVVLKP
jgi:hypothetical protein